MASPEILLVRQELNPVKVPATFGNNLGGGIR
jgi:hypothetical protein